MVIKTFVEKIKFNYTKKYKLKSHILYSKYTKRLLIAINIHKQARAQNDFCVNRILWLNDQFTAKRFHGNQKLPRIKSVRNLILAA